MDAKRFDRFTKAFGIRLSRRTALSTGAALAGMTLAGPAAAPALAQEATPSAAGSGTDWLLLQRFARDKVAQAPDGAVLILDGGRGHRAPSLYRSAGPLDHRAGGRSLDLGGGSDLIPQTPPSWPCRRTGVPKWAVVVELLEAHATTKLAGQVTATVRVPGRREPGRSRQPDGGDRGATLWRRPPLHRLL